MRRLICISLFLMFAGASHAFAATLEVDILGAANDDGDVHVALYNDPEGFPKSRGMLIEIEVPIENQQAVAVFEDLEPGRYAIAIYHDENSSNKFDQGLFGIPLEDFGFSNDATVFLSPPSFEDAAFDVPETGAVVRIHLNQ